MLHRVLASGSTPPEAANERLTDTRGKHAATNCPWDETVSLTPHGAGKFSRCVSPTTVARRLCTMVRFYRHAEEEGLIEHSPPVHVRRRLRSTTHRTLPT